MYILAYHHYDSGSSAEQTFETNQLCISKVLDLTVNNSHSNITMHLIWLTEVDMINEDDFPKTLKCSFNSN